MVGAGDRESLSGEAKKAEMGPFYLKKSKILILDQMILFKSPRGYSILKVSGMLSIFNIFQCLDISTNPCKNHLLKEFSDLTLCIQSLV